MSITYDSVTSVADLDQTALNYTNRPSAFTLRIR